MEILQDISPHFDVDEGLGVDLFTLNETPVHQVLPQG